MATSREHASRARFASARVRLVVILLLSLAAAGCALYTIDTMKNQELTPGPPQKQTRASGTIARKGLSDDVFIGIAMSGGGSRAANFSAAVLLELEKLGILDKATALSSVSGSSLPTAYYGLYGRDKGRWNPLTVKDRLGKDFEARWLGRWLYPQNILLYWTSNFNRSDIMKEVLDSNLFDDKAFADMGSGGPRILINSTTLAEGNRFVFSEEEFKRLNSRIDTYPIANAVMASSAFPGVFHDMTLIDHRGGAASKSQDNYEHVLDGGPSDNLGTTTLLEMVKKLYDSPDKPKGCFLFVVDAYPYPLYPAFQHDADTRSWIDFLVDTNVARASDAMLTARRIDLLAQLNVDVSEKNIDPPFLLNTGKNAIYPDLYEDLQVECVVWHLSLQRLLHDDFARIASEGDDRPGKEDKAQLQKRIREVAQVVNSLPTRYKLTGKDPNHVELSSDTLQADLFDAAHYLITLDKDAKGKPYLTQACEWFKKKGMKVCESK